MKIAVLGGGAVGLGLSSCLLSAGARLHLQLRSAEAVRSLARDGLRRSGLFGSFHAPGGSFGVGADPDALAAFDPDAVLVCTKATDRDTAADWLRAAWGRLPRPPVVVLCLNGWGNAERFAEALPRERIFSATITTGFHRHGWNAVEVTVHGDALRVGNVFTRETAAVEPLCELLSKGGLPSEPATDMEAWIWAKLLYNCALNPIAALRGVPYGAIGEDPGSRAILEAVVREIFAVLAATGRATRWPDADAYLAFFFGDLLPATCEHESSMLQDLRAGRATEIEAMSGAVARLGAEAGVSTPVNAALATLVASLHPTRDGAA